MSSVTRFLRQRQPGQTLVPVATGETYYVLIPGSGNFVGNYPNAPLQATSGYVVASSPAPQIPVTGAYIRDMGKTIFCAVSSAAGTVPTTQVPGYFRAVQIITPGTTVNGSTTNSPISAFGVGLGMNGTGLPGALPSGANPGDEGYNTYYIPISVGGTVPGNSTSNGNLAITTTGLLLSEQL